MTENENGNTKNALYSRMIKAGKRTYFINVKMSKNDKKYVTLTESKLVDANKFDYFNIMVFPEKMGEFVEALKEAHLAAA